MYLLIPAIRLFKLENETFLFFFSKLLSWISMPLMRLVLTQLSNVRPLLYLWICIPFSHFFKQHCPPLPDLQQRLPAPPALWQLHQACRVLQEVVISKNSSTFVFLISTQNLTTLLFSELLPPEVDISYLTGAPQTGRISGRRVARRIQKRELRGGAGEHAGWEHGGPHVDDLVILLESKINPPMDLGETYTKLLSPWAFTEK